MKALIVGSDQMDGIKNEHTIEGSLQLLQYWLFQVTTYKVAVNVIFCVPLTEQLVIVYTAGFLSDTLCRKPNYCNKNFSNIIITFSWTLLDDTCIITYPPKKCFLFFVHDNPVI